MNEQREAANAAVLARVGPWVGKRLLPGSRSDDTTADESAETVYEGDINHIPYRIITGGYTEDLQLTRLNVSIDSNRVVTRVWIG
ncbi:hypothetical protein H257_08821 [Aphanomyces astaci]|uniref:Uncharacterized protein n=1 Tax=Aphanomyces astaci TaxID=112090 RepID=W4GE97_APHAT|nr:hypothetical protein H257_08821 [Aphanomyces astaci]ETV77399.1 hypothetical protein H257_08821 [Aphanomyces astaci]|eukprot:XP_009833186.1 hypothetical protein H257_08821 [Aphanomyces astaci]